MKKALKAIVWIAGAFAVILVGLFVIIKIYVTKDRIMEWTIPPIERELDREVTIKDAGAGLAGFWLKGLDIRAREAKEPTLAAEELSIDWNLFALLTAKVKVDSIRLVEPRVRVVKRSDGTLDIDDIINKESAEGDRIGGGGGGGTGSDVALALSVVSIENGRVVFVDETATPAVVYSLDRVVSRADNVSLDAPFPISMQAKLPLSTDSLFKLSGTVDPVGKSFKGNLKVDSFALAGLETLLKEGVRPRAGDFHLDLDLDASGASAWISGRLGVRGLELTDGINTGARSDLSLTLENISTDFAAARVGKAVLELAGQRITLNGSVETSAQPVNLLFDIAADSIDVDVLSGLMPAAGDTGSGDAEGGEAESPSAGPPPVDLEGNLAVGELTASGFVAQEVSAGIKLKAGVLTINPLSAKAYNGLLKGVAGVDLAKSPQPFSTRLDFGGVAIGELLAAANPDLEGVMTGVGNVNLLAKGVGPDPAMLDGTMKFSAKDGQIVKHPMAANLATLLKAKEYETLNFYSLDGDFAVKKGAAKVNGIVLDGPNLRVTASGKANLVDGKLDLPVSLGVPERIAGKAIGNKVAVDALTEDGWTSLPLKVKGSMENPTYSFDEKALAKVGKRAVKQRVVKELEKKLLKEDSPAGKLLDEGLKSIFGD